MNESKPKYGVYIKYSLQAIRITNSNKQKKEKIYEWVTQCLSNNIDSKNKNNTKRKISAEKKERREVNKINRSQSECKKDFDGKKN